MNRLSILSTCCAPWAQQVSARWLLKNAWRSKTSTAAVNGDRDAYIVAATRTPIGSLNGSLASYTAPQLASLAIQALVQKVPVESDWIEEVQLGQVVQSMVGQNPAHQSALQAGLSNKVVSTTLNRMCSSSVKAYMMLAQSIQLRHVDLAIAGGMESLSNVPFYLPRGEIPYGGIKLIDGLEHDLTDPIYKILMGYTVESVAKKLNITRAEQDQYALESYWKSKNAQERIAKIEITPVRILGKKKQKPEIAKPTPDFLGHDEELNKEMTMEKLAKLRPAFPQEDGTGTITAGNTGKLTDGASVALLASGEAIQKYGLKPLAKIVAFTDTSTDSMDSAIATVSAITKVLERASMKMSMIDQWEINEAFSAVLLANLKLLKLDPKKVNVNGGAVAIGHPVGMSGSRIINHLALHMDPGQFGLATICNAGGGASAIIIEKL